MSGIQTGENFASAETIDKLVSALDTTLEELFSTNHLKVQEDLRQEIDEKLNSINGDNEKLIIVYNVIQSLLKE